MESGVSFPLAFLPSNLQLAPMEGRPLNDEPQRKYALLTVRGLIGVS